MDQYVLDLVCLLDLNADSDGVDARLDKDSLVLVSGDGQWGQQHLWRCLGFYFGNIVSFGCLGCEVGQRECSSQATAHALQIWPQRLGLRIEAN